MNCGMEMIKYLLFFVNFIATLCGIGLIFFGVTGKDDLQKVLEQLLPDSMSSNVSNYTTGLIVLGSIIAIIAFCGCCGALRESICLLNLFAIVFLTILVFQVVVGYFVFKYNDFENDIKDKLLKGIQSYGNNDSKDLTKIIDFTQTTFHCCGVTNYKDYEENGKQLPNSCCENLAEGEKCESEASLKKRNKTGCLTLIKGEIVKYSDKIKTIIIIAVIVEILCVILPLLLASSIRNADRGRYRV